MSKWLKTRLKQIKKTQAGLAAVLGVPPPRITEMIQRGRRFELREIRELASYLEWSVDQLLDAVDGPVLKLAPLRSVRVIGAVQAGIWGDALEWPAGEQYETLMPPNRQFGNLPRFGLEVKGPSMDEVYPDGAVVECVMLTDLGRDPVPGEHVICLRRAAGGSEATIKELRKDAEGGLWLWPRSSSPSFQQPWRADSGQGDGENEDVRIVALVVGSYQPRPNPR